MYIVSLVKSSEEWNIFVKIISLLYYIIILMSLALLDSLHLVLRQFTLQQRSSLRFSDPPHHQGLGVVGLVFVLGGGQVARLHRHQHRGHQVLGSLDERHGAVQTRHDQLTRDVVNISLDLAGDVELVTVEGDPAQVSEEVRLGAGAGTSLSYLASKRVQLLTSLTETRKDSEERYF